MQNTPSARLAAIAGLLLSSSLFGQDTALDLLHKMQRALGGADRIAGIKDFEQSVKANTWNRSGKFTGEVRKRIRWVKPNFLRVDQVGPHDTFVLYFDGTQGWEILPDQRIPYGTNGSVTELKGGELEFARRYLSGLAMNVWLCGSGARLCSYLTEARGGPHFTEQ